MTELQLLLLKLTPEQRETLARRITQRMRTEGNTTGSVTHIPFEGREAALRTFGLLSPPRPETAGPQNAAHNPSPDLSW